jgi:integrase
MKLKKEYLSIVYLYEKFLSESEKGRRLQKNGAVIGASTICQYKALLTNLKAFEMTSKRQWLFTTQYKHSKTAFNKEKKHYKSFYLNFTNFLYAKGCIDNYVGHQIKHIKTLFNYLIHSKGYEMGIFYKEFYARKEEIPVIVLNQEQLRFLIKDKAFENSLPDNLKISKDIFVVGCSTGLRYSDLINLQQRNIETFNGNTYIINKSIKTNTFTRIKLPEYVLDILKKYNNKQKKLLPVRSLDNFNHNVKKMAELAGWTEEIGKIRSNRGKRKDKKTLDGRVYRFCDHISSHVMRKTAITTLLILGIPEALVRKISGHAPNSKEFYKYVKYTDSFLDCETDKAFGKLIN